MNETVNGKDKDIQELIECELLHDDRVSSQNIKVTVTDGVATLTGTIASFRRKLAAQQIASAYDGIVHVENKLDVEPTQPTSDDDIQTSVRAALDSSADITKETVLVAASGGKVTLTGKVGSHWERVVAEDIARGVRGVRDIINMLVVNRLQKIDDHELMNSVQAALQRANGLDSADINVAIGEDMIVLSGTVQELWQKEIAQSVVGSFGLLHIRNELQVSTA